MPRSGRMVASTTPGPTSNGDLAGGPGTPHGLMVRRRAIALAVGAAVLVISGLAWARHEAHARAVLILRGDPDTILADPAPREIALADGRAVYLAHCAACHGPEGRGDRAKAMPDLTDGDFLYGQGTVGEIEQIVLHGIRAGDTRGWDLAEMPAYARPVPYAREPLPPLTPGQVRDLVAFLRTAGGHPGYAPEAVARGRTLFTTTAGCWDCHGSDAAGDASIGAPDLIDGIWLKGDGGDAAIAWTIEHGLAGVSPAFAHVLSPYEARVVAAYAASLHPQNPAR